MTELKHTSGEPLGAAGSSFEKRAVLAHTAVSPEGAVPRQPYNEVVSSRQSSHVVLATSGFLASSGSGALDSACNRTVVGFRWLQEYLSVLQTENLAHLASWEPEAGFSSLGTAGDSNPKGSMCFQFVLSRSPSNCEFLLLPAPPLGPSSGRILSRP